MILTLPFFSLVIADIPTIGDKTLSQWERY